jgi:signal transduction histidine kinase
MRFLRDKHGLSVALIVATLTLLPALAVLQYKWIGQVSDAEHERLLGRIRNTTTRMCQELNRELMQPASLFMGPGAEGELTERIAEWRSSAPDSDLVANFYLVDMHDEQLELRQYDPASKQFNTISWPDRFQLLRQRLAGQLMDAPEAGNPPPGIVVDDDAMAMLLPRLNGPPRQRSPLTGWALIEWNEKLVRERLLRDTIEKYFADGETQGFAVRIASRSKPQTAIYTTAPEKDAKFFSEPDAFGSILEFRRDQMGRGPGRPPGPPGRPPGPPREDPPPPRPEDGAWLVYVKHGEGSLEAMVASTRLKNLAIGFAVLLILGTSIVMLLVSTQRARRFAELQMEFVAGVSHELRTPLTVICSAGQNLADGLIENDNQMRNYGTAIFKEGRRLSEMVEQIMSYAGIQSGRAKYDPQPVEVSMVLKHATAACETQIAESGCRVEQRLEPDLPLALADPIALAHCVRNLLSNALTYAREGGWVGITAQRRSEPGPPAIEILVQDRGPGIEPSELPHIFEPFFRGRGPVSMQIRGAGIGLSLVKRIMEANGGTAEARSERGVGSSFTLTVPAIEAPRESEEDWSEK